MLSQFIISIYLSFHLSLHLSIYQSTVTNYTYLQNAIYVVNKMAKYYKYATPDVVDHQGTSSELH